MNKPEYLYLHVPFCRHICSYCDFMHSVYNEKLADTWLDSVSEEIKKKDISKTLKTIYIGGGTPTCLSLEQMDRLLTMMDPYACCISEYTAEANPETMTQLKAECMHKHGINRASVGYQTDSSTLLQKMNRQHTAEDTENCMRILKEAGICNISLDLMYSLPGQTLEMFEMSVNKALSMKPPHLSLYSLQIEPNTLFAKQGVQHADDELEADMYEWAVSYLPKMGFQQYEISNFCQPGFESLHNSAYWNYEDFYGISAGASGKCGLLRYDNTRNLNQYLKDTAARKETQLCIDESMFEMVMMGLRLKKGMSLSLFFNRFHEEFASAFAKPAASLIQKGLLEYADDRIRCTPAGYEIMNDVLSELMSDEVLAKGRRE